MIVGLVLLIEIVAIGYLTRTNIPDRPIRGYLIKLGQSYLITWRHEEGGYETRGYSDLKSALLFARDELKMLPGAHASANDQIEHLWMKSDVGGHILYWKTLNVPHLNRMTFARVEEAKYFERVFRRGAYSPSPIGHSISLVPYPSE